MVAVNKQNMKGKYTMSKSKTTKRAVAVEDMVTQFLSEFARQNRHLFNTAIENDGFERSTFLKMNYDVRRNLVAKTLSRLDPAIPTV